MAFSFYYTHRLTRPYISFATCPILSSYLCQTLSLPYHFYIISNTLHLIVDVTVKPCIFTQE
nr:MAG TPA: hypothetical protein [Caudoviricetes sp.]